MTRKSNWNPIAFTRLRITLSAGQGPWSVPIDYYRLLRASVYHLLAGTSPDLADFLHTSGFAGDCPAIDWHGPRDIAASEPAADSTERFKLFCYSSLIGDGSLSRGLLSFASPVTWFFATPLGFVADALTSALRQAGQIRLGRTNLTITDLSMLEAPAPASTLTAILLSPLVISATVPAEPPSPTSPTDVLDPAATGTAPSEPAGKPRQRHYLTRDDGIVLTEARLRSNLLAKHRALYGVEPEDPQLAFLWATAAAWPTPDRPTRLVRLSAPGKPPVRVRGSVGAVTLAGSPELLQIALHAGLGQHNASGMGFLLPESEVHLLRI